MSKVIGPFSKMADRADILVVGCNWEVDFPWILPRKMHLLEVFFSWWNLGFRSQYPVWMEEMACYIVNRHVMATDILSSPVILLTAQDIEPL